jgi:TRAP-type C4-dicarboxylate transport system substrate-binding protein
VDEAAAVIEAQMSDIDNNNRQLLVDAGMELIIFEDSFIDEVLDRVTSAYDRISEQVGVNLVKQLQDALEAAK